jgi:hypothetical protein
VHLPAWTSSEELLGSTTEGGTDADAAASRSLSLSRDPSLAFPGLSIGRAPSSQLARAGSGLPPKPSPLGGGRQAAPQASARAQEGP